jgi:hypothetical protein
MLSPESLLKDCSSAKAVAAVVSTAETRLLAARQRF